MLKTSQITSDLETPVHQSREITANVLPAAPSHELALVGNVASTDGGHDSTAAECSIPTVASASSNGEIVQTVESQSLPDFYLPAELDQFNFETTEIGNSPGHEGTCSW